VFLALRDLRSSWRRFILVGLVIALVAMLSTVLVGLTNGLVKDGTSGLRALPLTHLAFQPGAESVFSRSTLDRTALDAWKAQPGAEASPLGASFVNAASVGKGPNVDLALFGVAEDSFLVERPEGRAALQGEPGLVLAEEVRDEGVEVGDRFRFAGSDLALPVLGFTFAGSYGHVPVGYVSLEQWQKITFGGSGSDRFSAVALKLPSGSDTTAVNKAAGTDLKTKEQAYSGSPGYSAETATMSLIRFFLLVISALIVGAFFTVLIVQRTNQIGLLRAMGASGGYIMRDGLGQMTIVQVASTAVGGAFGVAIILLLENGPVPISLSMPGVLAACAYLVLAGLVGSFVSIRRISKIEPSVALSAGQV
jgi:putative ABC transport system permease protein